MMSFDGSSPSPPLIVAAATLVLWMVGGAVYRLCLSPLAAFPGPKLAALTLWYEFYYDVIRQGRYTWRIKAMHERYGPVVRISPHELHVADPDFYDELYVGSGKRRDKYPWAARLFGISASVVSTAPHDHHRLRRAALAPFFSTQAVSRLVPLIHGMLATLLRRLHDCRDTGTVVSLDAAFSALTVDVITEYCFGQAYGSLESEGFMPEWPRAMVEVTKTTPLNKHFPWLLSLMQSLPEWLTARLSPDMMTLVAFQKHLANGVIPIMDTVKTHPQPVDEARGHPTIIHEILTSDLPASEKTLSRLVDESQTIVAAGSIATAHYLKTVFFHILSSPSILERLRSELRAITPPSNTSADPPAEPSPLSLPSLPALESLPFLRAVVLEGFRVSYGASQRLPRICPEPLRCGSFVIPAGVPVGMTSVLMHMDPKLFPSPDEFSPERWLTPDATRLERYLVNFGKGSRSCLGRNLARAEIYLTLAALLTSPLELQLWGTDRSDVEIVHDYFNPLPRLDSRGVRVMVK